MRPIKLDDAAIEKILEDMKLQLQNSRNYAATTLKLGTKSEAATARPIIDFDAIAWLKYKLLIDKCDVECAWHGTVTREGLRFTVHDIICYPQTISGATVVTDETKYEEWHQELDDDTYNTLRLQGHSHVNFSATPSGVDTTMYEKMLETLSADSWYIFMIVNKKGSSWFEIHDLANNIIYENKDIDICVEDTYLGEWYKEQSNMFTKQTYNSNFHSGVYTSAELAKARQAAFDKKPSKHTTHINDTIPGFDDEPPYGYTDEEYKDPFYADDGKSFMKNSAPAEKKKRGRPRKETK